MKDIVIENFQKGIAPSPHLGFADMRNVDIESSPGVAKINNRTVKKSSTTVTEKVKWIIQDPMDDGDIYAIDDAGQIYTSTDSGGTWATLAGNSAGGDGQGMAIWKDYLFVAGPTKLDVYGPLSGSPAWTTNWKTLTSDSDFHPMLVGQDDILYIGNSRYVASLSETSGDTFDPSDAASYTFTAQALDLPATYRVRCLAELGKFLMIGTWVGNNVYDFKIADIFPWDRTATSFNLPLKLGENGISAMITINNLLYIIGGIEGKIFVSNGTQVNEVAQIPIHLINIENGSFFRPAPGAICQFKGRMFLGVETTTSSGGLGVWSFKLGKGENALTFEHTISTGSSGASNSMGVTALLPVSREALLIGWRDNSTYGIDKTDPSKRYTSYAAYIDSAFEPVGTREDKRTFTEIEFLLDKPLTSDQGIRLAYRTNLNDSFTTIDTFDFSTYAGITSYVKHLSITCEFIQIRVSLTTGESDTTPELRAVILR